MTMPGIITGQPISGRQLGNVILQLLPSLPHEGPPGMPRGMARTLYPRGFNPLQPFPTAGAAAPSFPQPAAAAPAMVPPAGMPAQPPAPTGVDARGNQIQRRQPMPQPNQVATNRAMGNQQRPIRSGTVVQTDPGTPRAIRMVLHQRRGM